ncbi:MAG: cobyric acid synthase [Deltaproteobacteria bacterium]|nr:cobyric acid synthase [Deltaproteobacteria bacterium]
MTVESKGPARCVAVLGTASDVGKSTVVTALCRVLSDLGVRVTPFKAQNMSNNSFVTLEGGEIGRAQAAQAEAARLEPHVDMNPVLLKPGSDTNAQVVLLGKPVGETSARAYGEAAPRLAGEALSSLERLRLAYDCVVVEGAGSCAEVNLAEHDFVNFRVARAADAPVILVADIDRGGVFAQIVGTLEVLKQEDRDRIKGFIINRFRGDPSLFDKGIAFLERRTGRPVLGLLPYLHDLGIDAEDAVELEPRTDRADALGSDDKVRIAVLRFPHISNFTDFSPLEAEPAVRLDYLSRPRSLHGYDLVLLPGTKNVRGDLEWLQAAGWAPRIREHVAAGKTLGGVCGGYQMLGKSIHDPLGVEGPAGFTDGLGLLDVRTEIGPEKILTRVQGVWLDGGERVTGYEIHQGRTERSAEDRAFVHVVTRNGAPADDFDGARSNDGRVWGTYLHGLFDEDGFRRRFLCRLRPDLADLLDREGGTSARERRERGYQKLAEVFRASVDMDALLAIIGLPAR